MKDTLGTVTKNVGIPSPSASDNNTATPMDDEALESPGARRVEGIDAIFHDDDQSTYVETNTLSRENQSDEVMVEAHVVDMVEAQVVPDMKVEVTPVGFIANHKLAVYAGTIALLILAAILVSVLVTQLKSNPPSPSPTSEPLSLSALQNILANYTHVDLTDPNTPQVQALTWLDSEQLSSTTPVSTLLTRFVLAAFYYATNGPRWDVQYNFLSPQDVCSWSDGPNKGVFCNSSTGDMKLSLGETLKIESESQRRSKSQQHSYFFLLNAFVDVLVTHRWQQFEWYNSI
jgi:hypothetical protein